MIALGDVSVTGKEITVTHTRYAFVKASRHADRLGKPLDCILPLVPPRQVEAFDALGAEVLARDRDRHGLVAMATTGRQHIDLIGKG